jgi:hypothetical protein
MSARELRAAETRRRIRRTRNDARVASHRAWVLRMEALETRLRLQTVAAEHRALVARLRDAL